jgi:hypothetical protein
MNEKLLATRNIKNGQKEVNMNSLTINKQFSKVNVWSFKFPTFSYCNRWAQV